VKKITITRREVIRAIKLEPLRSGNWVRPVDGAHRDLKPRKGVCTVCVVGGLLRRTLKFKSMFQMNDVCDLLTSKGQIACDAYESDEVVTTELSEGRYLNALSCKFELLCEGGLLMDEVRKQLITWVKESLPESFTIHIPKSVKEAA
jgi:hypothetical protein